MKSHDRQQILGEKNFYVDNFDATLELNNWLRVISTGFAYLNKILHGWEEFKKRIIDYSNHSSHWLMLLRRK